ncbi:hypothetical protein SDC9_78230 [bioreactor metagenome]|uniref:Uncharacterized protein n=1 Tax=bioreactor metagenome TaxID=1076179 RepID=A0A644YYX8_9ZZZZ
MCVCFKYAPQKRYFRRLQLRHEADTSEIDAENRDQDRVAHGGKNRSVAAERNNQVGEFDYIFLRREAAQLFKRALGV